MKHCHITTPEHVRFRLEIAGLAGRAAAHIVDFLITLVLKIAMIMGANSLIVLSPNLFVILIFLSFFLVDFGYHVYFELQHNGQSPGKKMLGIRVVSGEGSRLRFQDSLIRNIARIVDMLPMGHLAGGIAALADGANRRLGDMIAGTLVVKDSRDEVPAVLVARSVQTNTFYEDPAIRHRIVSKATRDEKDLLIGLALRKDDIDVSRRAEIFGRAAGYFRQRFALPEGIAHMSDEQVVVCLAQTLYKHEAGRLQV